MSWYRCNKWQDRDGVWHYHMVGPGRSRQARRKWHRETLPKLVSRNESKAADPEFEVRLGYLAYLYDKGIIRT